MGQTMEKYMQIVWSKNIVFRDSLLFLYFSLDSLVKSLVKSVSNEEDFVEKFNNLNTFIAEKYNDSKRHPELKLLIDSYEKLNEIVIPNRMDFFSTLTQEEISILDYKHAKNV